MKTKLTKAEDDPELTEAEKKFNADEKALYETFLKESKTKISKIALSNIRQAAKTLLGTKATINYTKIANFIKNIDNIDLFENIGERSPPPKYQTISNNDKFKQYINFFIAELERRLASSRKTKVIPTASKSTSDFPIDNLDNKTKLYVRMLQMQVESLQNEKKTLTSQLEEKSKRQPISLSLSHKNAIEKGLPGLEIMSEKSSADILLEEVLLTISTLPINFPEYFQEESRGGKTVLRVVSNSRKQMLFRSEQWKFITDTLAGD